MLIIARSRNCLQPRPRPRRPSSSAKRLSIRGSWDQNQCSTWQGEWADQPLPFDLHIAVCTVRIHPPSCTVDFTLTRMQWAFPRLFIEPARRQRRMAGAYRARIRPKTGRRNPARRKIQILSHSGLPISCHPPFPERPLEPCQLTSLSRCNSRAPKP